MWLYLVIQRITYPVWPLSYINLCSRLRLFRLLCFILWFGIFWLLGSIQLYVSFLSFDSISSFWAPWSFDSIWSFGILFFIFSDILFCSVMWVFLVIFSWCFTFEIFQSYDLFGYLWVWSVEFVLIFRIFEYRKSISLVWILIFFGYLQAW